jgi:hypothetical protein
MADLGTPAKQWLVSPTKEVEDMWVEVKKQELRSRISRWRQDIEDMEKGRIVDLRARCMMAELELRELDARSHKVIDGEVVIDDDNDNNQKGGLKNG